MKPCISNKNYRFINIILIYNFYSYETLRIIYFGSNLPVDLH